ncbi:MAG: glycosyltransferase [Bacteroidia bacterium]|nr:glycosyltransferase [Bacteroidia bacterium]
MIAPKRILVCPLDWGLGHATRCIPLINSFLSRGDEVIIGSCGLSGYLLKEEFPDLQHIHIPSFSMRYSAGNSQIFAILRALPSIILFSFREHSILKSIVKQYKITDVVSDNRFGMWCKDAKCTYITHQLLVRMPQKFRWLEPIASRLHCSIINHYDSCWIPDNEIIRESLSGELSHICSLPKNAKFIGPLSRISKEGAFIESDVLVILSGIEPHRSILENKILERYSKYQGKVILVEGLPMQNRVVRELHNIKIYPSLNSDVLSEYIRGAKHIICRSGYTSIMDMYAVGKLDIVEWIPTPGQPEQEYLALWLNVKKTL